MKNIIVMLFLLMFTACAKHEVKDSCCTKKAAQGPTIREVPMSDLSLYNLTSRWKNQHGKEVTLNEYAGKIQIVAMIYTGCSYACPRIVSDLKRIEENLKEYDHNQYNFLLVSMDPDTDTSEQLYEFSKGNDLNPEKWNLLTASDDAILELAAVLNVKYKRETNGEISHSNIITVLNDKGEIIFQQEGLGVEPDQVVKAVKDQLTVL